MRILACCATCQPFSTHTQKYGRSKNDEKWNLLDDFKNLVLETGVEIVTMENVPSLIRYDVFKNFKDNLQTAGYHVYFKVVYCPEYGIPQTRRRLVLLASKLGEIELIEPTYTKDSYPSVKDHIGDLPEIKAGETDPSDTLHRSPKLSEINLKRIKRSTPGGTWLDWDEELRAPCHKKDSGKSYRAVYGRMVWDRPGPTITTQFYNFGTGRFGHPSQDRALSLREGALLQTFPKYYAFTDPKMPATFQRMAMHIGNAVPVRLGYIIGESIVEHFNKINIPATIDIHSDQIII